MTVAQEGQLQCFRAENSTLYCALWGSLAEVMEFSISLDILVAYGQVIPEGRCIYQRHG